VGNNIRIPLLGTFLTRFDSNEVGYEVSYNRSGSIVVIAASSTIEVLGAEGVVLLFNHVG